MNKTLAIALWLAFGFAVAGLAILYYTGWLADAQATIVNVLSKLQDY